MIDSITMIGLGVLVKAIRSTVDLHTKRKQQTCKHSWFFMVGVYRTEGDLAYHCKCGAQRNWLPISEKEVGFVMFDFWVNR